MASVVASNVVNRVFGWVKQKNIRLIFDVSLLRNIKEKEQRLAGSKPSTSDPYNNVIQINMKMAGSYIYNKCTHKCI
jgi:hypothetical protein